ncbi:hypothetical protein KUF54_04685 [Comamonas sp. Y33R10-2]|nr:hypothetical protein KUF54_04685 [Comamonas sp. Y33R10-2]
MAEQTIETAARKILYILVVEQSLRARQSMSAKALAEDLQRHDISDGDQRAGLALAQSKGWLQTQADGAVELTDAGFNFHFNQ